MRKLIFATAAFLLLFNVRAFCQADNTALNSLVLKLHSFYAGHIVEKAYLHFDRPYYVAGDTIYFKAYVTFGEQHEPSRQSVVLYADLVSPQNTISQSIKLELKNGLAWGDFALPYSLHQGNYRVRAYTKLMAGEPGSCFFDQVIPIGSIADAPTGLHLSAQTINKPDIQFFAEGGRLLNSVTSKVAFKAIGTDGLGIAAKGVVVDNTGKTVASFSTSHLGMGSLNITPEDGKIYTANVTFADGTKNSVTLPAVITSGIVLAIDNSDTTKLSLGINCSQAFFDQNKDKIFGLVMNSGVSVSRASIKLAAPLLAVDLAKKQFRTGIVQFTLFSAAGEPLSERLVFIKHNDMLNIKVSADKSIYKTREKVSLSLSAKRLSDSIATGHFSVAVVDESKVPGGAGKGNSILSWILLSSDLKGYIEQPNYYFETDNSETQDNLDVLMLTQGYRRFTWTDLIADKYPPTNVQPEKALAISGSLSTTQGQPLTKEKLNLFSLDGDPMLSQETDTAGKFDFAGLAFNGSAHFMLKTASSKDKNKTLITWLPGKTEPITVNRYLPQSQTSIDSLMAFSLQSHKSGGNNAANYEALKKEAGESATGESAARGRLGKADQVVHQADLGESGALSDHLNGLLNGVIFKGQDLISSATKTPYLTAAQTLHGNPPMLVVVDGVALPAGSGVDDINITDVETVEVFKNSGSGALGPQGAAGVLYVTTVKRNSRIANRQTEPGLLSITVQGFYNAREFYSPKYEHADPDLNHKDLRSTIYWNPELVTDKNGNAAFDFYNADGKGNYRVVIEGIDEKGNLGRKVYTYKVE